MNENLLILLFALLAVNALLQTLLGLFLVVRYVLPPRRSRREQVVQREKQEEEERQRGDERSAVGRIQL